MIKIFYVILLNLLLFSKKNHFDALIVNPETLNKIPLEIEDSLLNEIKNYPKLQKRNQEIAKSKSAETKIRRRSEEFKNPYGFSPIQNYEQNPFLQNLGGPDFNPERAARLNTINRAYRDNEYTDCMKDIERKWNNFIARKRRKRVLRYLATFAPENSAKYLDYTNSQMPFNEGKAQHKSLQEKNPEVLDGSLSDGKKNFDFESELEPKRFGRSIRKHFEVPLRSQEENFKIFGDDPILKYSRVRRFLDHERAKKRKRMSSTLEAKEAAMSRVLDPNVNLEGILEPHVRKRRGQNTEKCDLTFNPRYKKKPVAEGINQNAVTINFQNEKRL